MNLDEWPKCAVAPCPNKCCLRLHSKYCWPHTPGVRPGEVEESLAAEEADLCALIEEPKL